MHIFLNYTRKKCTYCLKILLKYVYDDHKIKIKMSKIRRNHLKVLYISYKGLLTIIERSIYNLNQSNI